MFPRILALFGGTSSASGSIAPIFDFLLLADGSSHFLLANGSSRLIITT